MYWDRLMNIDTALYSNEKRHRQLWYFVVDTILSMSHPDTLVGAYLPAFTVCRNIGVWYQSNRKQLTLSCLGTSLVRHLALPVHISSSNGLMDMIGSGKVLTDVLAMRFNT